MYPSNNNWNCPPIPPPVPNTDQPYHQPQAPPVGYPPNAYHMHNNPPPLNQHYQQPLQYVHQPEPSPQPYFSHYKPAAVKWQRDDPGPIKRALIIGCNYKDDTENCLASCANDALQMKLNLLDKFGYEEKNVWILSDDPTIGQEQPTRLNIINGMKWLVSGARNGDRFFFHFSGHGVSTKDYTGDEISGMNQCLMPVDYQTSGVIVDDDINKFMIRPLPEGTILHALVDCCHSGSILDLQFVATGGGWTDGGPGKIYKGTSGGVALQFAACRDRESAYGTEMAAADQCGQPQLGAATNAFIEALGDGHKLVTYDDVLRGMMRGVQNFHAEHIGQGNKFVSRWTHRFKHPIKYALGRLYQRPQLSCNTDEHDLRTSIRI